MLSTYNNDMTRVIIVKNEDALWQQFPISVKKELYLVLRELMINMKKHANATLVAIKFELDNQLLVITYTDNGVGIKNLNHKNGLQNVETRINDLNGLVIFDEENNKTRIIIKVPFQN